jgi:Glu-tRNA(Gln) amidotransferase subunit E-like FAD-binding protein
VPEDCIKPLAMSRFAPIFDRAVKEWKAAPVAAAVALIQYPKRLRRKGLDVGRLDGNAIENILRAFGEKKLLREAIWPALEFVAQKGVFVRRNGRRPPPSER